MYYLFSFRSRSQSIGFFEMLSRHGIQSKLIMTPRGVSVGCGLSVRVETSQIDTARALFDATAYNSFLGLFYLSGNSVTRIER
jgi:hypothetical protein